MALSELQWGRILALAWLDKLFKDTFEADPTKAFNDLKDPVKKKELRQKYGDFILEELGLEAENISFIDLETMTWDGTDFAGMPGAQLQKCINVGGAVRPPSGRWFLGADKVGVPLTDNPQDGGERVLTAEEWGRLYSRIWMDHRLDELDMDPQLKEQYGPKKEYMEKFERDPARVVADIAGELHIEFIHGKTRLYGVLGKPADWGDTDLSGLVRTGKIGEQPLVWVVNKCC
ncbi:MAG: hypothetical protein HY267_00735 [Deltaproteobacteria bacterium]|nr:hypothetical protein [Deltaproteobacteria bacterium]